MLKFEDNKEPREFRDISELYGEAKPVQEGYIVLPVSEYNNLLRMADAAYNAITLSRRDYHNRKPIEATIDKHWLYMLVMDKLNDLYSRGDLIGYELLRSADDLTVFDITLAKLAEPTEED